VPPDPGLKDLLRIHLGAPDDAGTPTSVARAQPVAFAGLTDLDSIRHDYPVVLHQQVDGVSATPLARLLDGLLDETEADDNLRRDVFATETALKAELRKAVKTPPALGTLWRRASERAAGDGGDPEQMRERLAKFARRLPANAVVFDCESGGAQRLMHHAWQEFAREQADGEREGLDRLIAGLKDILEVDRAQSKRATSAESLSAAMAGDHAGGIDFGALSEVLRGRYSRRPLSGKRRKRLRDTLSDLEGERRRLSASGGNGTRRRHTAPVLASCNTCTEARDLFVAGLERGSTVLRAARIARLELENRYDDVQHGDYFEHFDLEQLGPEECRALPPVLVCLEGDGLAAEEIAALVNMLTSDLPIKVLLELRNLPEHLPLALGSALAGSTGAGMATMTMALGNAFVLQAPLSHLPALNARVTEGLHYPGPALFAVYTGPPREEGDPLPTYLHCAAAAESRMFPCFVYAPGRGASWADRLCVQTNPQPEAPWPTHALDYEDHDGRRVEERSAFTAVDFLATDARFADHFVTVSPESWHENMLPVAEFMSLSGEANFAKVPYLEMVDGDGNLQRVVARRAPVAAALRCAAAWKSLQELAGIGNGHVERALAAEHERLAEERARSLEDLQARLAAGAPPAPAGEPGDGPAAIEEEDAPPAKDTGEPYIETDFCTSCNDCTDRNSLMFAYDEAKQAYIRDPKAGSYRELVEAAENCPVCIIHPGLPLDSSESGLKELIARAEAIG
jgi:hypothetical protein